MYMPKGPEKERIWTFGVMVGLTFTVTGCVPRNKGRYGMGMVKQWMGAEGRGGREAAIKMRGSTWQPYPERGEDEVQTSLK